MSEQHLVLNDKEPPMGAFSYLACPEGLIKTALGLF